MKIEGLIFDDADITQETKTNRSTGEALLSGKFKFLTTNPTEAIDVKVNADLWANGEAGKTLKSLVGKRHQFEIQYREMSFGNDDGKHVSLNGFYLHALPQVQAK